MTHLYNEITMRYITLFLILFSFLHAEPPQAAPSEEITLYYLPYCPYSKNVLNYLQTCSTKVTLKNVKDNPQAKEELGRVGGKMQVPCLVVGDLAIYDDQEIIKWMKQHEQAAK